MSFILWTSEDDGIDLGNPFDVLTAWKELETLMGGPSEEYDALLGVPLTNEELISDEEVKLIMKQAKAALTAFGSEASDHLRWSLEQLAAGRNLESSDS